MQIAFKPRMSAGIVLLGLVMAIALTIPGSASAANFSCKGHIAPGTVDEEFENALDYKFACTARIVGYMIVTDREIDAFDTEIEVKDTAGAIVSSDSFVCEGDFPGFGFGCLGGYGANNIIEGKFSLSERKPCAEPRVDPKLIVVGESYDLATGDRLKMSKGEMAGPFDLGRPRKCPKSSLLGSLLAEVELMRIIYRNG